jgi:hypothetical protein
MTAQDLLVLINKLDSDDLVKPIEAQVHTLGAIHQTDSIRFDFDGGRLIVATKDSETYEQNKNNQTQEVYFINRR